MVILTHISSHPEGISGKVLCTLLTDGILAWVGAASSVVTLTAIAFKRYYAVIYPQGNKGDLSMRKVKVSEIIPRKSNTNEPYLKCILYENIYFVFRWLSLCNKQIEA